MAEEEPKRARATVADHLRKEIARGLEQAKKGELLDGEAVFRELEEQTRRQQDEAE